MRYTQQNDGKMYEIENEGAFLVIDFELVKCLLLAEIDRMIVLARQET